MNRSGGRETSRRVAGTHGRLPIAFTVLLAAALAASGSHFLCAQDAEQRRSEQSCRNFVQEFYNWYVAQEIAHEKSRTAGPPSNEVLRFRPQVLSPELAQALQEETTAQARATDARSVLDFDPFLNSQDPSPKFVVASVALKDGRCRAVVNGIAQGKKQERVMPELILAGESWVFVNFHYGRSQVSPDENLVTTLKQLRDRRNKQRK
jgi:hypothetical protein